MVIVLISLVLYGYLFTPITYMMSFKLSLVEVNRAQRKKKQRDTFGFSCIKKFGKSLSSILNFKSLLVHDYKARKESGELRRLRGIFEITANRLLKVNKKDDVRDPEESSLLGRQTMNRMNLLTELNIDNIDPDLLTSDPTVETDLINNPIN